jgi:hypothetical protein
MLKGVGHYYNGKEAVRATPRLPADQAWHLLAPYLGLGINDQALTVLQSAAAERSPLLVDLEVEPRYDGLRADSRFADLPGRLGLASSGARQ